MFRGLEGRKRIGTMRSLSVGIFGSAGDLEGHKSMKLAMQLQSPAFMTHHASSEGRA